MGVCIVELSHELIAHCLQFSLAMDPAIARALREAQEAPEMEVMPGVFMTDFRSRNAAHRETLSEGERALDDQEIAERLSRIQSVRCGLRAQHQCTNSRPASSSP